MYWCTVVTKNQQRILNHRGFSIVKSGGVNIHEFLKMNESWRYLHENEAYEEYKKWQFFILMKGICTRNYKWFCVAVNKSYVSFTCKFPMVMHFILILHKCCRSSKIIFMFLITTKQVRNTVKVSALNSVLVFTEKFTKIGLMNYADRGIASCSRCLVPGSRSKFGNWTTVPSVNIFKLSIVIWCRYVLKAG